MAKQSNSFKNKKVHFVGIKGTGMVSLVKIFKCGGAVVSGSDTDEKFYTDAILKKLGIKSKKFSSKNITKNLNLVVFSTAYKSSHPEIKKAKALKILSVSYAEALGLLFKQKIGIAVVGTHGKTTTSAMLAKIFKDAGLDPTVLIGGEVLNWKTGALCGKGSFFICEADEYQRKFLSLKPKAVLITNVEYDHPDYFKSFKDYKSNFKNMIGNIEPEGLCVGFRDDKAMGEVFKNCKAKKILYSPKKQKEIFKKIKLQILGEHNHINALGAFVLAKHFGISENKILKSLKDFRGTRRRLEFKNSPKSKFFIIDDFAHHPTEVKASINALQEAFPKRKIVVAFHPHTFSRTQTFLKDFASAFYGADKVAILDIYGSARERKGKIRSEDLVRKLKKNKVDAYHTPTIVDCRRFFRSIAKSSKNDRDEYILLTMGAGDVWKAGEDLL